MGLFTEPPTDTGTDLSDIPVADFNQTGQQLTAGAQALGWDSSFIAKLYRWAYKGMTVFMAYTLNGLEQLLAWAVQIFGTLQGYQGAGFSALIAAVMSDLLWVDISADQLDQAFMQGGRRGAVASSGAALYNVLAGEFSGGIVNGQLSASVVPAQSFVGYLMEFAVREGNIEFLSDFLPESIDFLKGVRAYGVNLANALGLGRLGRRALTPLVQTLVADPLQWALNQQYTPKLLSEDLLAHGLNSNLFNAATAEQQLAWQGYTHDEITYLLQYYGKHYSVNELEALVRFGAITSDQAVNYLTVAGIQNSDAQQTWQAHLNEITYRFQERVISEALTQYRSGLIDNPTFQSVVSSTQLLPQEQQGWQQVAGQLAEYPRKQLSESQLEDAYIEGIITLDTITNAWQARGYSLDAIQTLTLLLFAKQAKSVKTTTGAHAKVYLTETLIQDMYKAGVINLTQAQAALANVGFDSNDVAALSQYFATLLPAPGTTEIGSTQLP